MGGRSRSNSNTSMMSSHTINTSKSSVFTTTTQSLLQGTSSSYNLLTTLPTSDDVLSNFNQLITDLQSNSSNQRSIRIGACCTALIETAFERRATTNTNNSTTYDNGGGEEKEITPNELFIVTISSIQSIQSSLESLSSNQSTSLSNSSSSSNNITTTIENTIIPLLEIFNLILPYIAHPSNNNGALLIHQYSNISRMLRLFVVFGYSLNTANETNGSSGGGAVGGGGGGKKRKGNQQKGGSNTSGSNALLRQLLKVSTTLLLVTPIQLSSSLNTNNSSGVSATNNYGVSTKDIGKLLSSTIIQMTNDIRPKVRKAAWGCLMEIIIASSSSSGTSGSGGGLLGGGGDMNSEGVDKSIIKRRVQSQRQVIADYIWEYCHAILTNYTTTTSSNNKKDNKGETTTNKIIHILRFLAMAVPYADDLRIRIRFGEVCLLLLGSNNGGSGSGKKGGIISMDIMKSVLVTLLSCLEFTDYEEEGQSLLLGGGEKKKTSSSSGREDEMSKFASRTLAFLLQHRPNANASYNNNNGSGEEDVNVIYGQCLLSCMGRMLSSNNNSGRDIVKEDDVPPSKILAMKLLPNVMTSMLHLCESHNGEDNSGNNNNGEVSTCGSEFNQFISRMIPIVISYINNSNSNNSNKLHRIALEILPQCIPILQSSLKIQYRNVWGCILSGGYSSFISILSHWLLSSRYINQQQQSVDTNDNSELSSSTSELNEKIQQYIQTLVSSILKLHDDIAKGDSLACTAVEYATSTIIRGMGVELFVSVVDFVHTDDSSEDGKTKKKKMLSSSTIGEGGIRDDRAWLLPLLKQSITASGGSNGEGGGGADGNITIKTHLSFFQTNILTLARKCDAASADTQLTTMEISTHKSRVVELWSLLPNFCVYPMDIQENFSMVAKIIVKALGDYERYPKLVVSFVCVGVVVC